jgi:hypothetical protein
MPTRCEIILKANMPEMTPISLSLVMVAAFIHATWNILLKRIRGGLSFVWFVDILQGFVFLPWIVWVICSEKPRLGWAEWTFIVGNAVIHIAYYLFLQLWSGTNGLKCRRFGGDIELSFSASLF